jgi:hypothetical protein
MSGHQFVTSSWRALGFCSRTMIQHKSSSVNWSSLYTRHKTHWLMVI